MTQMQILLAQTTTTTEDDGNPLDFVGDFFDSEEWLVVRNVTLFFLFFMSLFGLLGVQFFSRLHHHCVLADNYTEGVRVMVTAPFSVMPNTGVTSLPA